MYLGVAPAEGKANQYMATLVAYGQGSCSSNAEAEIGANVLPSQSVVHRPIFKMKHR
jgi:hypothetical protein